MCLFEPNDDNYWGAKSQRVEKMLQRMAVLHLIFHIPIEGEGIRGLRDIHW